MSLSSGERFPKFSRIRKRGEYLRVQRSGFKVQSEAFVGLILVLNGTQPRLGITTSKRLGNAVTRNRTRRLVREAFRRGIMQIPDGVVLVVIAKRVAADLKSSAIFDDLALLGSRVSRHVERCR